MNSQNRAKHFVVFGSGTGTNLEALLDYQGRCQDPTFEVKALFTDRQCRMIEIGKRFNIPVIYLPMKEFFIERGVNNLSDPQTRALYDRTIVNLLEDCARKEEFNLDLIVLAGYMRLVTPTFLENFPDKVITVHPADLKVTDERGNRRYIGKDAVKLALEAGESRTRSTVIYVNEEMDGGPIITEGPWVEYSEGYPVTEENVINHQKKQKIQSDWPALIEAVCTLTTEPTMAPKKEVAKCVGS